MGAPEREPRLLVVAGETSGDRIAAAALGALRSRGVGAFGIAGDASIAAGLEPVARAGDLAAMGVLDAAAKAPAALRALARIAAHVAGGRASPRAALLVNFTETNARLGRWLRRRGVRVLWCAAPQVWAWRPARTRTLRGSMDRLAVLFSFEEPLWRAAGVDARWVGHPALDAGPIERDAARAALGLSARERAVALLPGSRAGEIARLAPVLCEAAARLVRSGAADAAHVVAAPGLAASARASLGRHALAHGLVVIAAPPEGASSLLTAFDLAICASGTACLEAALAAVPTVVAYRLDPVAYAVACRLVRTPFVALPNVLLGEPALPELLQADATADRVAARASALLAAADARDRAASIASRLRALLEPPGPARFGERLAALLEPWLGR